MVDLPRAYVAALDAHDWAALGELLDPAVVYEVPQSRERARGREAVVRFNREFPGEWRLRLVDACSGARSGVARCVFQEGAEEQTGIVFLRWGDEGRITSITDYWPEPYEPPAGRAHLVERW